MTTAADNRPRVPVSMLVELAGGNTALANLLRKRGKPITSQAISYWLRKDLVPARFCLLMSEITRVPPHLIRPDYYPAPAAAAA